MTSIFENVEFGDKFVTKDGRTALCINPMEGEKIVQFGILNQFDTFCTYYVSRASGVLWQRGEEFKGECGWNIVEKIRNDEISSYLAEERSDTGRSCDNCRFKGDYPKCVKAEGAACEDWMRSRMKTQKK